MTFRVTGEPRCPGCCVVLDGIVITFNEGWAWCPVCAGQALHAQTHLRYVLNHDVMFRCSVLSHGLRFYLPQPVGGKILNAIDQYERLINEPIEAKAAITAWPGFDLTQLPQSVRDRDREATVPYRRTIGVPVGYEIAGVADDGRTVLIEINPSTADSIGSYPCDPDTTSAEEPASG